MDQPSMDDGLVKHVLVVTDAEVTDEERIVQTLEGRDRMCSVICIDSAPNSHLAREMARAGRGVARFLTSDPEEKDIATSLDEIMEIFASPLMEWVSLVTDQPASDPVMGEYQRVNGVYGTAENFIPKGRNLVFLGNFTRKRGSFVDVWTRGENGGSKLPIEVVQVSGKVLSKLYWACSINRIEQLMGSERLTEELIGILSGMGVPVKLVPEMKVYRENRLQQLNSKLREKLVEISLRQGVICSETAYMATRKDEGGKVTMVAPVPNALPWGWDDGLAPLSSPNVQRSLVSHIPQVMSSNDALYSVKRSDIPSFDIGLKGAKTLFQGVPAVVQGRAILYDSLQNPEVLKGLVKSLKINIEGNPAGKLKLFVRDLGIPRVTIDLAQVKGDEITRPINIVIHDGDRVILEMVYGPDESPSAIKVVME
jgi:hypothetical protein